MKKHFGRMVLVCVLVLVGAGMGLAGHGKGPGDGTGPIHDVLAGVPFEFTGDVIDCVPNSGLTLDIGGGVPVQIQGIGPESYWESQGISYPVVGETLTAEGYTVNYNGVPENVAMSITTTEGTIQLRDPLTGQPLWQGGNGGSGGSGSGGHGGPGCPASSDVSN